MEPGNLLNCHLESAQFVVTRPDVDCALSLWVQEMNWKGEVVNGAVLMAKQELFERELGVPEVERLPGQGWIQSFCHV